MKRARATIIEGNIRLVSGRERLQKAEGNKREGVIGLLEGRPWLGTVKVRTSRTS